MEMLPQQVTLRGIALYLAVEVSHILGSLNDFLPQFCGA
jgi:hypothetical protein